METTCEDLQKDGESQLALATTIHLAKISRNQAKSEAASSITIKQSLRKLHIEQSLNLRLRDKNKLLLTFLF